MYKVRKVEKIKTKDGRRLLVALCGDSGFASAALHWMKSGDHPGAYPSQETLTLAVVIDEQLRVWRLDTNLRYTRVMESKHACGAGQDFAIGAMMAGATAKRAIQIAIERSEYAGFGVDCVRF